MEYNKTIRNPIIDIWPTLNRVQATLNLSTSEMAELLEMSEKLFLRFRNERRTISLYSALAFATRMNLTLSALYANRIDFGILARHYFGDTNYLPKRYTIGAFSKKRTVVNFLNYVQSARGTAFRLELLRHFQLTEAAFSDTESPINILFLTELLEFLRTSGFDDEDFFHIGTNTYFTNRESPIALALSSLKTCESLFERINSELFVHFDRNTHYRLIRLEKDGCIKEATPNEEVCDLLKITKPGNRDGCIQKAGTISMLPVYLGFSPAQVMETSCIHEGDSSCRFEVSYPPGVAPKLRALRMPKFQKAARA